MHPVGHSRDQVAQEVAGNAPGGFLVQFRKGKLTRAVDGYKEVELALLRPHLGDVDVEVADRIRLEPLLGGLVALGLGQARDAMPLQAAMQTGARQVRDRGLERVEAVIQRQKCVPPEGDNHGFLFQGQHGRSRRFRSGRPIGCRRALLPLGDGFWVNPVTSGENSQALLTILYCSTDRRRRAGAPMQNLAHSASFHSNEKSAPSKPGTKQLSGAQRMDGSTALPWPASSSILSRQSGPHSAGCGGPRGGAPRS